MVTGALFNVNSAVWKLKPIVKESDDRNKKACLQQDGRNNIYFIEP